MHALDPIRLRDLTRPARRRERELRAIETARRKPKGYPKTTATMLQPSIGKQTLSHTLLLWDQWV